MGGWERYVRACACEMCVLLLQLDVCIAMHVMSYARMLESLSFMHCMLVSRSNIYTTVVSSSVTSMWRMMLPCWK